MRRGFIGPIGDDLPALIAVMLALGLFFSGIVVALNTYNQKIASLQLVNGGIDLSRALLSRPVFSNCRISESGDYSFITSSYGVDADISIEQIPGTTLSGAGCPYQPAEQRCENRNFVSFAYLVAVRSQERVQPATLLVKVCK